MADRGVAFSKSTARRIVDAVRDAEATPLDLTGADLLFPRRPRCYRPFELTEQLNAGGDADVKWLIWNTTSDGLIDTGLTGEVTDHLVRAYGLIGERGEAVWHGGKWLVLTSPGQGIYYGTLAANTTSSPANVTVAIGGTNRTVSCVLRATPASGKKYASGTKVYVGHFRGSWEIVSILSCTVSV